MLEEVLEGVRGRGVERVEGVSESHRGVRVSVFQGG